MIDIIWILFSGIIPILFLLSSTEKEEELINK
jgi:hypothetical protein